MAARRCCTDWEKRLNKWTEHQQFDLQYGCWPRTADSLAHALCSICDYTYSAPSILTARLCRLRKGAAGFEDGTSAFLSIAALRHGFAQLQRVGGFEAISQHTRSLSRCCSHSPARAIYTQPLLSRDYLSAIT